VNDFEDTAMLTDFAAKLRQDLESKLPALKELLPEREIQAALEAGLRRLNLVTREEFDAQAAVLQRTRMLLEDLEKRCAELEMQRRD
jgi:ubiquinone biosynthesis accessory factor UbiK